MGDHLQDAVMNRFLIVGDPHVTVGEINDCTRLFDFVAQLVQSEKPNFVVITGDLHNNHDTMSVRVNSFWREQLGRLNCGKILLRGNHDQAYPDRGFPHALEGYETIPGVDVVVKPKAMHGLGWMPYVFSPEEFRKDAAELVQSTGVVELFCHGTFDGGRYENGFYAKDAVDPNDVPVEKIWSGHIHAAQEFGKVTYFGSPRARTRSDANTDRHLWMLEGGRNLKVVEKFSTRGVCRQIITLVDRPGEPAAVPAGVKPGFDDVRIDVYGPDPAYVSKRRAELAELYGAKTRPFPDRQVRTAVSEARGVAASLGEFLTDWLPPHGSPRDVLIREVRQRVAAT